MMYFGEDVRKAIRKEDDRCILKVLKIPTTISDIVIDWDEQYRKELIELIKKGEEYRYAFMSIICEKQCEQLRDNENEIKKLNKQIDGLLELNEQLMDSHSQEFSELEEIKEVNKTLDAYSIQLLCEIKDLKRLLDDTLFVHKVELDKLSYDIEKLESDNLSLDNTVDMKDNRILELKQEVNDYHWFGKKPYNL